VGTRFQRQPLPYFLRMFTKTLTPRKAGADKAGDWPPLHALMSGCNNISQLQNDIAEWFRENNQPEAYELAGPGDAGEDGNDGLHGHQANLTGDFYQDAGWRRSRSVTVLAVGAPLNSARVLACSTSVDTATSAIASFSACGS
jgi:hypothetical protein